MNSAYEMFFLLSRNMFFLSRSGYSEHENSLANICSEPGGVKRCKINKRSGVTVSVSVAVRGARWIDGRERGVKNRMQITDKNGCTRGKSGRV